MLIVFMLVMKLGMAFPFVKILRKDHYSYNWKVI